MYHYLLFLENYSCLISTYMIKQEIEQYYISKPNLNLRHIHQWIFYKSISKSYQFFLLHFTTYKYNCYITFNIFLQSDIINLAKISQQKLCIYSSGIQYTSKQSFIMAGYIIAIKMHISTS